MVCFQLQQEVMKVMAVLPISIIKKVNLISSPTLGTAEEIAAVAVYLASDDATFTTGSTIHVDGGISI